MTPSRPLSIPSLLLAIAACSALALPTRAADPSGLPWTAAWTANPAGSTGIIPLGTQTLREIVSPHRSGDTVRLRLTNREGRLPVSFAQVWIGTQKDGAELVPGSNRQLTFNGRSDVRLMPGQDILSDPIAYKVTSFTKLAISMQSTGPLGIPAVSASHPVSRETNYFSLVPAILGGGAAKEGAGGFKPFTLTQGVTFQASWHYITSLDVVSTDTKPRVVVAFGDSITDGLTVNPTTGNTFIEDLTTLGDEHRYPDFLQRRFDASAKHKGFSLVNAGIAGNRLTAGPFAPFFGPRGLDRLQTDVIDVPGVTDVIAHFGINDIAFDLAAQVGGSRAIGQTVIQGYRELIARLHAKGIRVVLGTIMPGKGAGLGTAAPLVNALSGSVSASIGLHGQYVALGLPTAVNGGALHGTEITDSIRREVNAWIRTQGKATADGVIDFDACMRDPVHTSVLNPAYNSGDNLHPTAVGFAMMAACVDLGTVFP